MHFVDYAARHKTLLHKTLLHKLTAPSGGWGNADNIQKVLRGQPGKQKQHRTEVNDEAENCSARLECSEKIGTQRSRLGYSLSNASSIL